MKTHRESGSQLIETLERRQLLSGGLGDDRGFVHQTNLVTSGNAGSEKATFTDPTLINPWGLASSTTSPFWVSDNGAGVTTLYNGTGAKVKLQLNPPPAPPFENVVIPPATGSTISNPTGQVFAGGDGFIPDARNHPGVPAVFIFVGEDGGISAWNPAFKGNAVLAVDNGNADQNLNAVYKGVTIGDVGTSHFLYAANFRAGQIEVYNTNFTPVTMPGGFVDKHIPAGFAPFNVQSVGGNLIVTYAKQNATKHDDVAGAGNGFVDEFNTQGVLVRRFDRGRFLDSPWGVAQVPATATSWGKLAGDTLVGQFGSGRIDIFAPDGDFRGFLHDDVTGQRVTIDGLWALRFGNGAAAGPTDTLFFTAGTAGESAGLFGSLTPSKAPTLDQDHDHHDEANGDQSNRGKNKDDDHDGSDSAAQLIKAALHR